MSRELRRVPLDFNHPLNTPWPGFIGDEGGLCPGTNKTCFLGQTPARAWLDAVCHLFQLLAEESTKTPQEIAHFNRSGRIFPHPYLEAIPHAPRVRTDDRGPHPLAPMSKDFVELYKKISGHDQVGQLFGSYTGHLANALVKVAGFDERWGICPICDGHGDDPALRAAADAWKPTPPPDGPGFQVWESVTSGSPISPVFKTEIALENWLVANGSSRAAAKFFIGATWEPSMSATVSPTGAVTIDEDTQGNGR